MEPRDRFSHVDLSITDIPSAHLGCQCKLEISRWLAAGAPSDVHFRPDPYDLWEQSVEIFNEREVTPVRLPFQHLGLMVFFSLALSVGPG